MISDHPNRIHDLLDDVIPAARSAAQTAASRRNGARSRGPVTAAGKAASRCNALKHGLLGRAVMPAAETGDYARLYRRSRQQIIEQFHPAGFTGRAVADALAGDYVQLARVRTMIESLQRPDALTAAETEEWLGLAAKRRDRKLIEALVSRIDGGRRLNCAAAAAKRLAGRVADMIQHIEADRQAEAEEADPSPPPAALAPEKKIPDAAQAFADAEAAEQLQLDTVIAAGRKELANRAWLVAVLSGRRAATKPAMKRLGVVLAQLAHGLTDWTDKERKLRQRTVQSQDAVLAAMAADPAKLMLLDRYRARLEAAIAKKIRALKTT